MKRVLCMLCLVFAVIVSVSAQSDDVSNVNVRLAAAIDAREGSRLVVIGENGEWIDLAQDFELPASEGFYVAWSPDCSQIAFTADTAPDTFESTDFGIFTYDFLNGEYSRLVPAELEFPIVPTWSPDGERLFFMQFTSSGRVLNVMDTSTNNIVSFQLPFDSFGNMGWAEDGNSFVISTFGERAGQLYLVDLKQNPPSYVSLMEVNDFIFDVVMLDRGTKVVLIYGENGIGNVYMTDLITGEISLLTQDYSASRSTLSLSSDESMVAYSEVDDVYVMNVDGTDVREITDANYEVYGQPLILGWTQDSQYVVFESAIVASNLLNDVYAAAVDGSGVIRLTDTPIVEHFSNFWYACFPQEE